MSKIFRSSGAAGDIMYSLPTMTAMGGGILAIHLDNKAVPHNTTNGGFMKQHHVDNFKEFLPKICPAVEDVVAFDGTMDVDLDLFRNGTVDLFWSYLPLAIAKLHKADIGLGPYITLDNMEKIDDWKYPIVVNRSKRYRDKLDWEYLKPFEKQMCFIGLQDEYEDFVKEFGIDCDYHKTSSFMDIGTALANSKLFVGNQSFCYAIAEMAKINRVLEICHVCPNSGPYGKNSFTKIKYAMTELKII